MHLAEGIALAVMLVVCGWVSTAEPRREEYTPVTEHRTAMPAEELSRLLEIANVPMEQIIAAAEYRATHPDEPIPQILVDLDPSLDPKPRVQDAAPAAPPGVVIAPINIKPALDGFRERLNAQAGKAVLLEPGMDFKAVPYRPRPKREPAPDPYADCIHWEADRAEVCPFGSAAPVKTFVTDCPRCDRVVVLRKSLRQVAEVMKALVDGFETDDVLGAYKASVADLARYNELTRHAEGIKRELDAAARCDEADRFRMSIVASPVDEPQEWPGGWKTQFQNQHP